MSQSPFISATQSSIQPIWFALLLLLVASVGVSCEKETIEPTTQTGTVSGKVTDAAGKPMAGVKVTAEHTVWHSTYAIAETNQNGHYKIVLPDHPAGNWTVKSQCSKVAYDQTYVFDLDGNTAPVAATGEAVRNFTWKLSGPKNTGNGFYGAHVDLYAFGVEVPLEEIKLVFTPVESTLIDGSLANTIERKVEDIAGTYRVKDIPIGKYSVKAVYAGKTFLLDNRHKDDSPEVTQTVVFGKYGFLAETEYNIEFWISQ